MKKKFKMPTAFTIIALIILIIAILTWIVPAGQYKYVDPNASKLQPIAGTYHTVAKNPQGFKAVVMSPVNGFYDAVDIIFFTLIIGGFLGIIKKTGAIDAGIGGTVKKLNGKEKWIIPIIMILFAIGGTTFGMSEETLAFFPVLLPVFIAAGYDSITTVSVIKLGAGLGCTAAILDPFAIGVASRFAGISIGKGMGIRFLLFIILTAVGIIFTMSYAEKVRKDPSKSLVYDMYDDNKSYFLKGRNDNNVPELTSKRKLILFVFALTFLTMIIGEIPWSDLGIKFIPTLNWWFGELSALFLVSSIIIAVIAGIKENDMVNSFVSGSRELLGVALIIGLSRGITIIMNSGRISDTVLHLGEVSIAGKGSIAYTILTYLFYLPMSFLIPSTSGLATLSMPIMAPLSDFAKVGRDVVITAFTAANGVLCLFTPTSAVVMGGLAIARVPYDKWLKYVWKVVLIVLVITIAVLTLATLI